MNKKPAHFPRSTGSSIRSKIHPSPMPDSTLAIHNPHDTIEQLRLEIVADLRFNHSFDMRTGYFTRSIR